MPFPISLEFTIQNLFGSQAHTLIVNSGLTILIGPNGSGKTQMLRYGIRYALRHALPDKQIRFLASGRLALLDLHRADLQGQTGDTPSYEQASFGSPNNKNYRHRAEGITGDFHTLEERPDIFVKVKTRLKALFGRDIKLDWDAGNLKAQFTRSGSVHYAAGREASGLLHMVNILAALYDESVSALMIDEPEISLHPQLQAFLMRELELHAGHPDDGKKIIVIATHSPAFIKAVTPTDLCNFVFLTDCDSAPKQIAPDAGEFQSRGIRSLTARIGHEHKSALFANKPILVEGIGDTIVCNSLDDLFSLHLNAAGSQILPVGGKEELPSVVKLLRMCGKSPIVLADLDAFIDSQNVTNQFIQDAAANDAARRNGHRDLADALAGVRTDFGQAIASHWEDIRERAEQHFYWTTRRDEGIARSRAALAVLLINEPPIDAELWANLRSRILFIMSLLESAGCFFLKRGTIESYFDPSPTDEADKVMNAVREVAGWTPETSEQIGARYADVLCALGFAGKAPVINESAELTAIILAIASPALSKLTPATTVDRLRADAFDLVGKKSSLVELEVIQEPVLTLRVKLNSPILSNHGFPIDLPLGSNPVEIVARSLS